MNGAAKSSRSLSSILVRPPQGCRQRFFPNQLFEESKRAGLELDSRDVLCRQETARLASDPTRCRKHRVLRYTYALLLQTLVAWVGNLPPHPLTALGKTS